MYYLNFLCLLASLLISACWTTDLCNGKTLHGGMNLERKVGSKSTFLLHKLQAEDCRTYPVVDSSIKVAFGGHFLQAGREVVISKTDIIPRPELDKDFSFPDSLQPVDKPCYLIVNGKDETGRNFQDSMEIFLVHPELSMVIPNYPPFTISVLANNDILQPVYRFIPGSFRLELTGSVKMGGRDTVVEKWPTDFPAEPTRSTNYYGESFSVRHMLPDSVALSVGRLDFRIEALDETGMKIESRFSLP
jgi:hypothetical protein